MIRFQLASVRVVLGFIILSTHHQDTASVRTWVCCFHLPESVSLGPVPVCPARLYCDASRNSPMLCIRASPVCKEITLGKCWVCSSSCSHIAQEEGLTTNKCTSQCWLSDLCTALVNTQPSPIHGHIWHVCGSTPWQYQLPASIYSNWTLLMSTHYLCKSLYGWFCLNTGHLFLLFGWERGRIKWQHLLLFRLKFPTHLSQFQDPLSLKDGNKFKVVTWSRS